MSRRNQLEPVPAETRAYLLGQLAAGLRRYQNGVLQLRLRARKQRVLELLSQSSSEKAWCVRNNIYIESPSLVSEMQRAGIPADSDTWRLPEFDARLSRAFLRGMLEASGKVPKYRPNTSLYCSLEVRRKLEVAIQARYPGATSEVRRKTVLLTWHDANALDLLGDLYEGAATFRGSRLLRYWMWASSFPLAESKPLRFHWKATEPGAVSPFKTHVSDSGFDLTLVREVKRVGRVVLYGTALAIRPPAGWYFDVVPRSSIIRTGHVFANSVGVIDRGYRGEIMVPLIKFDESASELELPARVAQLVPRPIVHMSPMEVTSLEITPRGSGGFGSTGR
jgi:deoxyuridine 5'-triphosphate nucleotidohydrolase